MHQVNLNQVYMTTVINSTHGKSSNEGLLRSLVGHDDGLGHGRVTWSWISWFLRESNGGTWLQALCSTQEQEERDRWSKVSRTWSRISHPSSVEHVTIYPWSDWIGRCFWSSWLYQTVSTESLIVWLINNFITPEVGNDQTNQRINTEFINWIVLITRKSKPFIEFSNWLWHEHISKIMK